MAVQFYRASELLLGYNVIFEGGIHKRRAYTTFRTIYPSGRQVMLEKDVMVERNPNPIGVTKRVRTMMVPPSCTITAVTTRYLYNKSQQKWVVYSTETASYYTGRKNVYAMAWATGYNSADIKVELYSTINLWGYYVIIDAYAGGKKVATKSFKENEKSGTATESSFSKTYSFTGLSQGIDYYFYVTVYVQHSSIGESLYANSVPTNSVNIPTISSYLSTVTATKVEPHTPGYSADVYWRVSSAKPNARYKIYYINRNNNPVDVTPGGWLYSAPAGGYTTVTVNSADLTAVKNITFFVRAYSSASNIPSTSYNQSNSVSAQMWPSFDWDVAKIAGQTVALTAAEWNRCKEFTGAKVPSFKNSDYYKVKTIPGEIITNEEIQAVLTALSISRTLGDGSAIAANIFAQIKTAINS